MSNKCYKYIRCKSAEHFLSVVKMCNISKYTDKLYLQIDYDLQATLVETVLRLLGTTEREMFAGRWFAVESVKSAFLSIKNQDFENVCKIMS